MSVETITVIMYCVGIAEGILIGMFTGVMTMTFIYEARKRKEKFVVEEAELIRKERKLAELRRNTKPDIVTGQNERR